MFARSLTSPTASSRPLAAFLLDSRRPLTLALIASIFVLVVAAIAALLHRGRAQHGEAPVESVFGETAGPVLKQQFRQVQRMEALGRLTLGVAHDFNNILAVVKGCAESALEHIDEVSPARTEIEEIRRAAASGAALTRQLLIFSRRNTLEPVAVSVNEVVRPLAEMLRRLIGEHIEVVTLLEGDAGHVLVDPGSIEQVVMNLVVNARDAMPMGGTLTIRTATAALDGRFGRTHQLNRQPTGPVVSIAVADTGHGLSPDEQTRIFEPFFTTKGPGQGTGLGLATVQSIVQDAGGWVVVESIAGRGTTFTVYLPRVEGPVHPPPVIP